MTLWKRTGQAILERACRTAIGRRRVSSTREPASPGGMAPPPGFSSS
jgi:hypothetical protein